jgi:hypothetical protein
MANYSIALGAQPPQIDVGNALALAAQMQRQKAAEAQAQQGMELDRQRFGLQQQEFQRGVDQETAQRNALAEYTKAQQGGDENALSRLSAYPELQSKVLAVRNSMAEAERGQFDQKLIRNARRAQQVMGVQGDAKQQAWMGALDDAVQSGDITPQMYEQYAAQPPNDLLLQNIVQQAVPIQQLYQPPTANMQELEAAGIEPGTEEFRERIAPAPLPKFEKLGNRLVRINPDGSTADMTPPGMPMTSENPPAGYRYTPDGQSLEAIPGGPATKLPGDMAGRVAALQTAKESFADVRNFYEGQDWGDRASQLINSGSAGRVERNVRLAIEAALRAMTGAAAPESEVENYLNIFGPSALDTQATIKDKLDRLESFMGNVEANIAQGRSSAPGADGMKDASRLQQEEPTQITTQQEYQALPPGTQYIAPDGNIRIKQ